MTALQLQLQLTERAADAAERAEALGELKRGLQRAIHLVGQLLTLARQEPDSDVTPAREALDLADLAALALTDHSALARAKDIDLGAGRRDPAAQVVGDAAALRTMVGCLLDNAIRYTPAGGRVDLSVGVDGDRVVLEIADSGPGIPPAERERVFDRFYRRAGQSQTGSGLGLAIVKAIAERHQAEVELGVGEAGGLLVRIAFPRAVPA